MTDDQSNEPILPAHIEDTVRAIAELHAQHHREASAIQRVVDRSVRLVARPRFVVILTLFTAGWVAINLALAPAGRAFDAPPFAFLADLGELAALYITVLILITQRHENELTEHREQLTLELAILGEQKNAKIIQLIEELRRDSPTIKNRKDAEAEALSIPADPQAVLDAIKETQVEMLASVDAEVAARAPASSDLQGKQILTPD